MEIIKTTIGNYPRPDWFKKYLRKHEGLQKDKKEGLDKEEYTRAVSEVIGEQKKAGIDIVTDGQLLWHDMLCFMCTRMEGFKMGGLIRYFDNNMYYRMPTVTGKLERKIPLTVDEFSIAKEINPELKAVLSCYSIAALSKDAHYNNRKDLVMDIAEIMNAEAKDLADAGAKYIQIDEPALLYAGKDDIEIAKEAFDTLTRGVDAKFFLTTYFGGAKNIFPEILDFPVDVIGLDFVEGCGENLEMLAEHKTEKIIQAGVVDGRTTRMENPEDLKRKLTEITNLIESDTLYISPNTGLEFLPYIKASEKLEVMCTLTGGIQ